MLFRSFTDSSAGFGLVLHQVQNPKAHITIDSIADFRELTEIKIKGGKQFNFTDPEGNADRLFVFQRDVDKARQRLLKGDQPAAN